MDLIVCDDTEERVKSKIIIIQEREKHRSISIIIIMPDPHTSYDSASFVQWQLVIQIIGEELPKSSSINTLLQSLLINMYPGFSGLLIMTIFDLR